MRPVLALAFALVLATFVAGCSGSDPQGGPGNGDGPGDGNGTMGRALPAATHFEFGPAAGCQSDPYVVSGGMVPLPCASFQAGPDATGIDGHWLALDETYWGLNLDSTVTQSPTGPQPVPVVGQVLGDSDCVVTDDALAILADGSNGTGSCTLVIPSGTAYLFIWPYGSPATDITVDFELP